MPRRLLDQDARREQRRQALLIERISRASERLLAAEIRDTTLQLARIWSVTGQVQLPPEHTRKIKDILSRTWRVAIQTMGRRILEQGKSAGAPGFTKAVDDESFFREVQERWLLVVGGAEIAEDISRTTVKQIMSVVAMGRREGLAQNEISDMINERASPIGRARGALIARTETHSAGNFGALETAKQTGMQMRKEWISAEGERTRESHAEADGQIVDIDQPFEVGGEMLMYPGDQSASAKNVINCRCAQGFVVVD